MTFHQACGVPWSSPPARPTGATRCSSSHRAAREAGGGLAALIPANMRAAAVRVVAGVALIGAPLPCTAFDWLILLVGAQLSFYVQNRNYLRMGLTELRLSAVQREQLTLKVMYLIAKSYQDGKERWTVDALAHQLGMPGIAISRIVNSLEAAKMLTLSED